MSSKSPGGKGDQHVGADPLAKPPTGSGLLAFGATWCAPFPLLTAALEELRSTGVDVRIIDISDFPHHAETYRVISVPTFVVLRAGRETKRRIGATSAEDLKALTSGRR